MTSPDSPQASLPPAIPLWELFVHHPKELEKEDIEWLEKCFEESLRAVVEEFPKSVLAALSELECSLVDDATIAEMHREFMDDETPTDVITFPHGEIIVSVDTAERQGLEFGKSLRGETLLYLIHGLFHLAGFDDLTASEAKEMALRQESLWDAVTAKNLE